MCRRFTLGVATAHGVCLLLFSTYPVGNYRPVRVVIPENSIRAHKVPDMTAAVLLLLACTHPEHFLSSSCSNAPEKTLSPKEALQPFNMLVGSWKGSGAPDGTKEERLAGAWTETIAWVWKFKGQDAWLAVTFDKGKHFTKGELRYTPEKGVAQPRFTLTLTTADKSTATFVGELSDKNKVLTLTRTGGPAGEEQRLVFSLLHNNRYLYRLDTRPGRNHRGVWQEVPGWRDQGRRGLRECTEGAGVHC